MKAYLTLEFDRPIIKDKHCISPGGYEIRVKDGTLYPFDFCEYYGFIDDKDSTTINFELRNEDEDSFPDIQNLKEHIHEIVEFTECSVYTGETDEEELRPVKIREFIIQDYQPIVTDMPNIKSKESTEFIVVKMDKDNGGILYTYVFTEKLLNTCPLNKS